MIFTQPLGFRSGDAIVPGIIGFMVVGGTVFVIPCFRFESVGDLAYVVPANGDGVEVPNPANWVDDGVSDYGQQVIPEYSVRVVSEVDATNGASYAVNKNSDFSFGIAAEYTPINTFELRGFGPVAFSSGSCG
jgi:hypothetical protein